MFGESTALKYDPWGCANRRGVTPEEKDMVVLAKSVCSFFWLHSKKSYKLIVQEKKHRRFLVQ